MKEITIYGDNRHEKATKSRIACRGILIRDGKLDRKSTRLNSSH